MEWKVKEGEPFPVGLGPDSPMERMRVPLYIRQGGQAMDRGLYRWELNRGQSFLTAVKGLASEERENTPEILVSSETLSLTEQEFFEWIQGKKTAGRAGSGGRRSLLVLLYRRKSFGMNS